MLVQLSRNKNIVARLLYRLGNHKRQSAEASSSSQISPKQQSEVIIQKGQQVRLMQDNFQKLKMSGLQQRDITDVDQFQRDILIKNKFDLMHPRVNPKTASLSTTLGLEGNHGLTEVNLGKIKVKQENQIFLSEVDPDNIPEYYDIIFDYQKQMSLVGQKLEEKPKDKIESQSQTGEQIQNMRMNSEMQISTRRAFEQRTQQQIGRQILGVGIDPFENPTIAKKQLLFVVFIMAVFIAPIIETQAEVDQCKRSIQEIEGQRMEHIKKVKRQALGRAIMNNDEMRIVLE